MKTKLMKRTWSAILAAVLLLSVFPLTASAADTDTGKAIQLGTSVIADGDKANAKWDYVYYGTYNNSPIKWRVLSKNGNGGTYKDNDDNAVTAPIFLLSEYILKNIKFENTTQDDNDGQSKPNDWQNSDAQDWCRDVFAANSFSNAEKKYVLKTTKNDNAINLYGHTWGASNLQDDTAFFISVKEASDYLGSNAYDAGLKAEASWWLRSVYRGTTSTVGDVSEEGVVYWYSAVVNNWGARPAFNLNHSSVIFTSAAEGGKPEAFGEVAAYSGNEWKLTILDDSRSGFAVGDVLRTSDGKIHISYVGAATGENEYISAIIESADGTVTHYGRLAKVTDESGTTSLDLTDITLADTDKLYIFNEQYNGDKMTDLAGELCEVTIPSEINAYYVTYDANGGVGSMEQQRFICDKPMELAPNNFTHDGYTFIGWNTKANGNGTAFADIECISLNSDVTLYAQWSKNDSGFDSDLWYWMLLMLYKQEFDITATATDGGTVSPVGVSTVKYSNDLTYTITPDDGYAIADVIVDGKSVGAVSVYTFDNVQKDHEITAIFAEIPRENPYSDVSEDDWFYEDVQFVTENKIMNGTVENEIFAPDLTATRAMIVTILWRLEGEPVLDYLMRFEDVPQDEWYTEAVRWAAANGIVLGYDGLFSPENPITREQLAAILHRYAAYKGMDSGVIFPMIPQYDYSEWAENDIIWADMNGLLDGIGNDMTDMTADASRAEVAAILRRFCERFAEE